MCKKSYISASLGADTERKKSIFNWTSIIARDFFFGFSVEVSVFGVHRVFAQVSRDVSLGKSPFRLVLVKFTQQSFLSLILSHFFSVQAHSNSSPLSHSFSQC